MAKKDKSFFGKIMGGNVTDDDNGAITEDGDMPVMVEDMEVEELVEEQPYDEAETVMKRALVH